MKTLARLLKHNIAKTTKMSVPWPTLHSTNPRENRLSGMPTFRPSANFRFAGDPDVTPSLHPRGWPFLRDLLLLGTCNSDLFFTSIRWTVPDFDESLYGRDVSHQYDVEIVSALLVSMNPGCLHAEQVRQERCPR